MTSDREHPLDFDHANDLLLESFPELQDAYRRELQVWGKITLGQYIVYGGLFASYIETVLDSGEEATALRLFEFVERLAGAPDTRLRDLIALTVCEQLLNDPPRMAKAGRYMGRLARKVCRELARG